MIFCFCFCFAFFEGRGGTGSRDNLPLRCTSPYLGARVGPSIFVGTQLLFLPASASFTKWSLAALNLNLSKLRVGKI